MNALDLNLDEVFKRPDLASARQNWRALCDEAERESGSYRDLLAMLAVEKVSQRQQTRLQRLARKARFPLLKTIDEFNFTFQSSVQLRLIGSYLSPDFVTDGRFLVRTGKPGRGKTHLAIAMTCRAIQSGFEDLFTTAAALMDDLSAVATKSQLRKTLQTCTAPGVLVLDEVACRTCGPDAANGLFHVVNEQHQKRRPMIFPTQNDLTAWGKVLHDAQLAEAIVVRILERRCLRKLDGSSMEVTVPFASGLALF
jgi:DNA replication protein DnaC